MNSNVIKPISKHLSREEVFLRHRLGFEFPSLKIPKFTDHWWLQTLYNFCLIIFGSHWLHVQIICWRFLMNLHKSRQYILSTFVFVVTIMRLDKASWILRLKNTLMKVFHQQLYWRYRRRINQSQTLENYIIYRIWKHAEWIQNIGFTNAFPLSIMMYIVAGSSA